MSCETSDTLSGLFVLEFPPLYRETNVSALFIVVLKVEWTDGHQAVRTYEDHYINPVETQVTEVSQILGTLHDAVQRDS